MRIAKAMAHAGLCSRREAERWIADGRVSVNGKLLKTPAVEVSGSDKIFVDGKPLPTAGPPQLWRYHKPKGIVTTHSDPQGRPTVFEKMPPEMPRVISVGRLDFNTEGLLLLTNDGELARHLELPINGWVRRYRVRAKGRVAAADLTKLKDGITIDGVNYGPIEAAVDSVQGANTWLTIAIREGKNREVRNVLSPPRPRREPPDPRVIRPVSASRSLTRRGRSGEAARARRAARPEGGRDVWPFRKPGRPQGAARPR